jgi:hypothetical protein
MHSALFFLLYFLELWPIGLSTFFTLFFIFIQVVYSLPHGEFKKSKIVPHCFSLSLLLQEIHYCTISLSDVVNSNLETKPKRFGIVPEFVLLRTDCYDLVQNLLSWTK